MSIQTEEAVLKIGIDKKQASLSLDELKAKYNALSASISKMNKEDDPQLYEKRIAARNTTKQAIEAENNVINGGAAALKKYQEEFVKGQKAIEASVTNNPIKKFTTDARTSFEKLNTSVQKSAFGNWMNSLKGGFSSIQAASSPFFTYLSTGWNTASIAVNNYKTQLDLQKKAVTENIASQQALDAALVENTALQEANNAQLLINKVAQEEAAAAVLAATTLDEAEAAALTHKRLVQEEVVLTTKAQKLAENEATIATEAQTVALEAQTLAAAQGTSAMRVLKIALASTGIGALIVAIASLIAYFAETNEGSKKLQVIMAQLNAVLQECFKIVAPLGKAIYETFSKGQGPLLVFISQLKNVMDVAFIIINYFKTIASVIDDIVHLRFKDAFNDAKDGLVAFGDKALDIGKNIINMYKGVGQTYMDLGTNLYQANIQIKAMNPNFAAAAKAAKLVTEERQRLVATERTWSGEKLKQQGEVALLTKQLRDQNLTEAARIQLAEKAKSIREQIFNRDLAIAKQNEALVIKEQNLNSKKDLDAIQSAKNRVQQVINDYNTQDQNITNRESMLNKRQETRAQSNQKAYDKLLAMAKSFTSAEAADLQAKNDKEVALVEEKYDDRITSLQAFLKRKGITEAQAANTQALIAKQTAEKENQVDAVQERQEAELTARIKSFHEQITNVQANELQKRTDQINQHYDTERTNAGNNADQIALIEKARKADLDQAQIEEEQRFQDVVAKLRDEGDATDEDKQKAKLISINQHYDDELATLKKDFSDKLKEKQKYEDAVKLIEANRSKSVDVAKKEDPAVKKAEKQIADQKEFSIKTAQQTSDAIFSIMNKNRQADTDARIKTLEDQKAVELSNKNLTEAQKNAINDKYAKQEAAIKLDAWKAEQKASAEQAIINGALAVTKALAQVGPLGAFVIPGIIAETAIQVAVIEAQKPPEFATGGLIKKGGLVDGPSHAAGGVPLINGNTGRPIAEVEGDETVAVFSKNATRNNAGLINQLLFSSMYRNGARVNMDGMSNGIRMEKGGYMPGFTNSTSTSTAGQVAPDQSARLDRIEMSMQDLQAIVKLEAEKKVVWSNQTAIKENEKLVQIRNKASGN